VNKFIITLTKASAHLSPERMLARLQSLRSDRGAATAEYAIVIMAAVAFAGLLVVIMRSDEVRAILTNLVQSALTSGG
jgi:Flp pilus assembly pilin Flp